MSDPKPQEPNCLPLFIIAALFFAILQSREGGDQSRPVGLEAVARKTLPNIRQAYRDTFLEAAKLIEDGTIKDQEGWTAFVKENAGAKQKEAMNAVYTAIDQLKLPVSFAGKEKEIAELNRRIGGAW